MAWWKVLILVSFVILFIGLLVGAIYEIGNYHESKDKLKKLNSAKDHLRAPDIHDSEKQNNTEPDIHDSEKQNNTEPDIHDSEKQNNTKKWEFERIVLEIEEQELSRDNHYAAFVAWLVAACVGVPFVLLCGHIILECVRHPNIKECAEACPVLSFFTSRFCPLPRRDNVFALVDEAIIARFLRVLSPETALLSVVNRRTGSQDRVLGTAADLPGVPSTSNDSER